MGKTRTKCDQIIRECLGKVAQVILQSRVQFPPLDPQQKRISKWFNLELEELDLVMAELSGWRANIYQVLYIDVFFEMRNPPLLQSPSSHAPTVNTNYTPLMERWKLAYEPASVPNKSIELPTLYKHLAMMVRSLFGSLRLMPSYRVYRSLLRNKMSGCALKFSFRKVEVPDPDFASKQKSEMKWGPVYSPFGALSLTAIYKEDCSSEAAAAAKVSLLSDPLIIKDYMSSSQLQGGIPVPSRARSASDFSGGHTDNDDSLTGKSAPIGIPNRGMGSHRNLSYDESPLSPISFGSHTPSANSFSPSPIFSSSVPTTSPTFPTHYTSGFNGPSQSVPREIQRGFGPVNPINNPTSHVDHMIFNRPREPSISLTLSNQNQNQNTHHNQISQSPNSQNVGSSFGFTSGFSTTPPFPVSSSPSSNQNTFPSLLQKQSSNPNLASGFGSGMGMGSASGSLSTAPYRLSISLFKETTLDQQPPLQKPFTNPKVSVLYDPSALSDSSLMASSTYPLTSSSPTPTPLTSLFSVHQNEPAFAVGGSMNVDGDIGEFIKMCQSAPPLHMFESDPGNYQITVAELLKEQFDLNEFSKMEAVE